MNRPNIHFNEALNGIELTFKDKLDDQVVAKLYNEGFRWSRRQHIWYAKRTPEREKFVKEYFNPERKVNKAMEIEPVVENKKEVFAEQGNGQGIVTKKEEDKKTNVFASYFDSVGGDRIYQDAEVSIVDFRNGFRGAYFEKENAWVSIKNNDETIYVAELDGAMENKSSCKVHVLSLSGYDLDRKTQDAVLYVCNELKFKTVAELIQAVKEGHDLKDLQKNTRENKGYEVFTPFKEVSPLIKMPDKWTKTQLVKAICSGQIYQAVCDHHYSDDYAYDAACNFDKGKQLSLPVLAKDYVEDWDGKVTSVYESWRDGNQCVLKVSKSYESISLYFDLDFDMEKGALKRAQMDLAREEANQKKEKEVLSFEETDIIPDKFYNVTYLVEDNNTKEYVEMKEMVQGITLIDYDEPDKFYYLYEKTVDLEEKQITPNKFYEVSNPFYRDVVDLTDERCIPMGNHVVLISGQALLECAAEGIAFPYINDKVYCGNSFEDVKNELNQFIQGKNFWGIDVSKVNYKDSLGRVYGEEQRVEKILRENRMRQVQKPKMSSLFDRISAIEQERKQGEKGKAVKNKEFERV